MNQRISFSSINFKQYEREPPQNSAVMQALAEEERGLNQVGVAGMSAFQEDRREAASN